MTQTQRVVVVGAGLMGSGIAQVSAVAGHDVVLRDVTDEALARGRAGVEQSLNRFVAKDRISRDDADAALARITTTTDLDVVAEADVVVEAVFESLEVKTGVFTEARPAGPARCRAGHEHLGHPDHPDRRCHRTARVGGRHALLLAGADDAGSASLVRGYKTSDETLATARAFAESVGKTVVVVNRDVAGFVTTRLISALVVEAVKLLESGVATAEDIDTACRLGFGHPMGPLQTADLTGVDILRNASRNIYTETQDEKFAPPETLNRMVTAGDIGRKSGRGFYPYD
nr:3-hydroxyacyl-CoA dehydrogenase family protein [Angustibacter aerolatus]